MAKENKTIGRVPVSRHEYTDGATYYKDNIVTRYGSAFQCVVDSTTTPPATVDALGKVTLGEGWIFFADASGVQDVKNGVAALERDLGQYAELPSVAMTAETTGKYINADGEFVGDADFNIAAVGAVAVGNTYELYMGGADKMKLGVALFVARIKTTTTSGTERIEYVPLFSATSTDIPTSGYVCFEAMEAYSDVLVCYRADVPEAATLLVRRYGTKASIATQINNLRKKVDLKSFADGYYESMRVGTADNLTSKGDATEEVIMSRKAGGDNQIEDGSASIKRIKGFSVVRNQVFNKDTPVSSSDTVSVKVDGNKLTYTPVSTPSTPGSTSWASGWAPLFKGEGNGDYYYYGFLYTRLAKRSDIDDFVPSNPILLFFGNAIFFDVQFGVPSFIHGIGQSLSGTDHLNIMVSINDCIATLENVMVINLTKMFGSGNEPTTPDDFAKRLGYSSINDVPYISYNEGEIVSSFAEGIKTTDTEGKVSERNWGVTLKKYCPDGLKSAGSAYDEITPTKAVKRIRSYVIDETVEITDTAESGDYYNFTLLANVTDNQRYGLASAPFYYQYNGGYYFDAWAIGFASASTIVGCVPKSVASNSQELKAFLKKLKDEGNPLTVVYSLTSDEYEEYTYDELNLTEQVAEGGTEEAIIVGGKTSTPLRADIVYPIDAYNTIKANKTNIGTLSSLNTANKTDLVSAINELAGKVGALEAKATEATNVTTE